MSETDSSPAQDAERPPARVVYILGAGRSGSTLLDAILGLHPDVFAPGELRYLDVPQQGEPRRCSCGELVGMCPFWTAVRDRLRASHADRPPSTPAGVLSGFERLRGAGRLAWGALTRSSEFQAYSRATRLLIGAILQEAGAAVVADSSKSPVRGAALGLMDGLDVTFVQIVRDPRGVAWSRIKSWKARRGQEPYRLDRIRIVLRTGLDWVAVNLLSQALIRRRPGGLRLRYEDLVTEPEAAFSRLSAATGLDLSPAADLVRQGGAVAYGHAVGGNPRRLQGPAQVRFDREWAETSPRWIQRLTWLITAPLAKAYGYER